MKNLMCVVLLVLAVTGCEREVHESTYYPLPKELEHCKQYESKASGPGGRMTIIHCPNATTTTQIAAKTPKKVVVIDGVEYEKKESK